MDGRAVASQGALAVRADKLTQRDLAAAQKSLAKVKRKNTCPETMTPEFAARESL